MIEPTYPIEILREIVINASLEQIREISKSVEKEKELYSFAQFNEALILISKRSISLAKP